MKWSDTLFIYNCNSWFAFKGEGNVLNVIVIPSLLIISGNFLVRTGYYMQVINKTQCSLHVRVVGLMCGAIGFHFRWFIAHPFWSATYRTIIIFRNRLLYLKGENYLWRRVYNGANKEWSAWDWTPVPDVPHDRRTYAGAAEVIVDDVGLGSDGLQFHKRRRQRRGDGVDRCFGAQEGSETRRVYE